MVPLHPAIIDQGFFDFAFDGNRSIFRDETNLFQLHR